ncbi:MAG: malate dehydrogenase [Thermoplasmata archaeon]
MRRNKISIIGAGNVGASLAQFLAIKELGDIYLFDVVEGIPEGKSLDIMEASAHWGYSIQLRGFTVLNPDLYENLSESDIIVITSGMGRKPGMTRDDLLEANLKVMKSVGENIRKFSENPIIIVVTNPADAMAYAIHKITGISPKRIIGLGGALDSARFRTFIALELGVSVEDVSALVIGGHGDDMVPLIRFANVSGIPLTELMERSKIDELVKRTRFGGDEIVNLLKSGGAYYAPAISITSMIESIIKDKKRVIPCAAYLSEEDQHYGAKGVFIGVPVLLGKNGVERIFNIHLSDEEKKLWERTVLSVKKNCRKVDEFLSSVESNNV